MCFILQDYERGKQLSSQISGTPITTVLEGRKENHNEEKPDLHKLPPHSLNFTNKAKEQNISIFFLFFCPKSISIFKTTALCNRWTITHRQSKPGNIKTFSTFLVWCHFWRQCLSEITFTLYLSLRGHPRYHNAVMDREEEPQGKLHQEDEADELLRHFPARYISSLTQFWEDSAEKDGARPH